MDLIPEPTFLSPLDTEAHELVRRVVRPGDLVLDATAGNGHDTAFLAQLVGADGHVLAFDVQSEALDITRERLTRTNCQDRVSLLHRGHEDLEEVLDPWLEHYGAIRAAMFNLGFLPGSDKHCTTQPETTLAACKCLIAHLAPGGVISIHVYTGHEGGRAEAQALLDWTAALSWKDWQVRQTSQHNKPKNREHLLLVQRRGAESSADPKPQTPPDANAPDEQAIPVVGTSESPFAVSAAKNPQLSSRRVKASDSELPAQRVLAVDDAPENLRLVVETLRNEYVMMVATNGLSALQLAKANPQPDVILLDVVMPGINGYEVCRLLKEDPATRDIPVLFLTSASESNYEARGLGLGAVDYIHKPFQPDLLRTRVRIQTELVRHRTQLEKLVRTRTHELTLTREVTIDTLANLAECRSLETGSHIRRTQHYVRLLADAMREFPGYASLLPKTTIEQLEISAPLHDVGKVGVPDAVLLKPGTLTAEEFETMKLHTVYGRDTMAAAERKLGGHSFLSIAKDIAFCHHERWDGKGYPQGLSRGWIPLSARIMSVADVYDALRSPRVYKPALTHGKAANIILTGCGTHFDPDVVEAFKQQEMNFQRISIEWADEHPS